MVRRAVIDIVLSAGIVVMPSDTVYGLMSSALSEIAVTKLMKVKNRENKPGTLLFANQQQLLDFGFDPSLIAKAMAFWPGPVSVILPSSNDRKYISNDLGSLAVRIPEPQWLRDILEQTGPLATTSANLPGQPTVTTIGEAKKLFGEKVDLYVDGGEIKDKKPSKIIRINFDGSTVVLRD